ncbi:MAG: hypothetical protein EHJ95_05875, partial [Methanobacteriota archaeon]
MKLRIKIKNKPSDLISLFFTVIIIIMMSFSQGCAEQGDTSPEPAATPANSGVISADNLTNIEWQWTGFQQSG